MCAESHTAKKSEPFYVRCWKQHWHRWHFLDEATAKLFKGIVQIEDGVIYVRRPDLGTNITDEMKCFTNDTSKEAYNGYDNATEPSTLFHLVFYAFNEWISNGLFPETPEPHNSDYRCYIGGDSSMSNPRRAAQVPKFKNSPKLCWELGPLFYSYCFTSEWRILKVRITPLTFQFSQRKLLKRTWMKNKSAKAYFLNS